MPNGFTDEWHGLRDALRHVRAMAKDDLTEAERDQLNRAISIVDKALWPSDGSVGSLHEQG
jgi:hypothetical protein